MTPHDEWDYDGVNEMILADQNIGGTNRKILVHFDRNGFGYTLDRANGELLVAEKYDPTVNWATKVDMDKNSQDLWSAAGRAPVLHRAKRSGRQLEGHLPGSARHQGRATGCLFSGHRPVLRADQSRLHGL